MSDDKSSVNSKPSVMFDDAVEYLTKRAPRPCPSCGENKWTVHAARRSEDAVMAHGLVWIEATKSDIYGVGVPLVTATCKKCAFMRLHNADAISTWIRDGKPEYVDE